jgi:predicted nucleotide-binding protein (sugar kinase/HSP70/actin superfamily)
MSAQAAAKRGRYQRVTTPPFLDSDRRRTLISVPMDPMLFAAVSAEFRRLGYRMEIVPEPDRQALEHGLKHVNNEICYPAILTIGSILQALGSGKYPQSDVAVALTQTGGPCRASNYIPLLKKAMVSAGFSDVPVVSLQVNVGDAGNEQPGFTYSRILLLNLGLQTIAVTDALSMMQRALAPRERNPGQAARLGKQLVEEWAERKRGGYKAALDFVEYACREMASIPVVRKSVPQVGIVGEVYVKYSAFANHHLEDWLVAQGIEAVVPPLTSFFVQEPVNAKVNYGVGLDGRRLVPWIAGALDGGITQYLHALNRRLARFPYPSVHFPIPRELAKKASRVISLTHQYGEGWVLGGEVIDMVDRGITKVVCLQPFGCIANQVIARGIERRLRAECPDLELLFLDLDHNTSDANLYNRLRLLITPPPRMAQRSTVPSDIHDLTRKPATEFDDAARSELHDLPLQPANALDDTACG